MDQPVLQRASPVHSGVPPCRAPASSTSLPTWFVTGQKDVVTLQPVYSPGEWQVSRRFATMLQCFLVRAATHCGSFRNDDILQCPEQFCSLYPLRTCFLNATLRQHWYCGKCKDSFWTQAFSACCSALRILPSTSRTETIQGWMHLPYETRGVLPRSFVVGDGMLGSRSLASFAFSLSSLVPPLRGVLTSFDNWIGDRS